MIKNLLTLLASVVGTLACSGTSLAAINDLYPGDYIPAEAGQSALVLYGYDRKYDGVYAAGSNSNSKERSNDTVVLLAAQYFDFLDKRFAVSASAGWATQTTTTTSTSRQEKVEGATDPKVSLTMWPYINPNKFQFLSLSLAYIAGAGNYDNGSSQNIGQNRDRGSLSLSWAQRLWPDVIAEVTGEMAWYGKNTNFGSDSSHLGQRTTQSMTGFLRYRLNDRFSPYIGYQANWGGETLVNGVAQGDTARMERAYLGLRISADPQNIFHIRAESDTKLVSGYKQTQGVSVRWTVVR